MQPHLTLTALGKAPILSQHPYRSCAVGRTQDDLGYSRGDTLHGMIIPLASGGNSPLLALVAFRGYPSAH
jgi:hypothetical protein